MSVVAELEKLASLRASGVISDDEFENLKRELLAKDAHTANSSASSAAWIGVKLHQKWWFQVLLALLLTPIGLLIMLFSKSYFKKRDGSVARRSVLFKLVIAILALFVWAYSAFQILQSEGGSVLAPSASLPTCDSFEVRGALTDAIENSVSAETYNLRLLDVQNVVTISRAGGQFNERKCNAKLVLNDGEEFVGYTVRTGTDGMTLVSVSEPFPEAQADLGEEMGGMTLTDVGEVNETVVTLKQRPELSENELSTIKSFLTATGWLSDRDWKVISSTRIDNKRAAVLFETPMSGDQSDCHACAPPLSMFTFDTSNEYSPSITNQEIDFAEIGTWGHTASVYSVTTPDLEPAFAFAYSFSSMGEEESSCVVYAIGAGIPEPLSPLAGSRFECPQK